MKAKSWVCDVCKSTVSELGAYVKISLRQFAHLACVEKVQYDLGFEAGQRDILDAQFKAKRERDERELKERQERARSASRPSVTKPHRWPSASAPTAFKPT